MNKTLLIISREYLSRVKKKSFIIMTFLGPILMASIFVASIWLSLNSEDSQNIMVVDDLRLFNQFENSENIRFDIVDIDLETAKKVFHERDEYSSLLYLPENILYGNTVLLFSKKTPGFISAKYIEAQIEKRLENIKLKYHNIDKKSYDLVKTHININQIESKRLGQEEEKNQAAGFIGLFFAFIIYMFIFLYGTQVMRGVIEEKTNRIVEVIISSVKPFQLMMGKIIGIALVGLTQFLLWIVFTFVLVTAAQTFFLDDKFDMDKTPQAQMTQSMQKELLTDVDAKPSLDSNEVFALISKINFPYILTIFVFYFLGGYLLYGAFFAAVGAAVDAEVDTQQFIVPISAPLIFGIIVAQITATSPDNPVAYWFSIFPFTSPVVMMVKIATVPFFDLKWDLLISMSLLILTFVGVTWLAAKIYRVGILMYGKKISYQELWKWIRNSY
jgi:ABC-2 type transport system permease protein